MALIPPSSANDESQLSHYNSEYNPTTPTKNTTPRFDFHVAASSQRLRKRHGVESNRSQLLLTPPLTPSSSIRTVGSVDSQTSADEGQPTEQSTLGHFLLIGNVPRDAPSEALRSAFLTSFSTAHKPSMTATSHDPIKGMYMRHKESHGIVILAFCDTRDAAIAKDAILNGQNGSGTEITCRFIGMDELILLVGRSPFLREMDSCFSISVQDDELTDSKVEVDMDMLKTELELLGSVKSLDRVQDRPVFHVEYYDVRAANSAYIELNGRPFASGSKLTTFGRDDDPTPKFTRAGDKSHIREPLRIRPRSVSAGNEAQALAASVANLTVAATSQLHDSYGRRSSNHLFFDAVGKHPVQTSQPKNLSVDAKDGDKVDNIPQSPDPLPLHRECVYCPSQSPTPVSGFPISSSYYNPHPAPPPAASYCLPTQPPPVSFPGPPSSPLPGYVVYDYNRAVNQNHYAFDQAMIRAAANMPHSSPMGLSPGPGPLVGNEYWFPTPPHLTAQTGTYYHDQQPFQAHPYYPPQYKFERQVYYDPPVHPNQFRVHDPAPPSLTHLTIPLPPHPSSPASLEIHDINAANVDPSAIPSERNQLNIARIEEGHDTRTTIMIKNIPNKMNHQHLFDYIGRVCPRRIDFLYLRIDFNNSCNVGYAFVNFIDVQDLLAFAKARLGERWNMFSSEKVLQMSYANYQGKEALVEKFRNSCIMDEREEWRPRIFHSDPGPQQGFPEDFPPPTHIRRKERSSQNRGALFVPGLGPGTQNARASTLQHRHPRPEARSEDDASSRDQGYSYMNRNRVPFSDRKIVMSRAAAR